MCVEMGLEVDMGIVIEMEIGIDMRWLRGNQAAAKVIDQRLLKTNSYNISCFVQQRLIPTVQQQPIRWLQKPGISLGILQQMIHHPSDIFEEHSNVPIVDSMHNENVHKRGVNMWSNVTWKIVAIKVIAIFFLANIFQFTV